MLNPNEYSLLNFLTEHGYRTIKELANSNYINEQEIQQYIDSLVNKGYVVKFGDNYSVKP